MLIKLIIFCALTYCFNMLVKGVGTIDWTMDLDPSSRRYIDLFYIVLPSLALFYANVTRWIFAFHSREVPTIIATTNIPRERPPVEKKL